MKVIPLVEVKEKLDAVSPSMCLAKWTQTTIYLNSGSTHSCHHPGVHQIPLDGLTENPGQIHNTPHKQEERKKMLRGERPAECDYCWRIEDLGVDNYSDRIFKSATDWSYPRFDEVLASAEGANIAPSYLEVLFESTCNFSCVYCMPEVSSKIWADVKMHGPYKLSHGKLLNAIGTERDNTKIYLQKVDENPYIEAFWKIIPTWWSQLNTFRITGGEPLLSKHTWAMMDFVEKNANKELTFAVNTNMGVPSELIDKLISRINEIQPNLKTFEVYTSAEAAGPQAEYIRTGMVYETFLANVRRVLNESKAVVTCMTTINALSHSTFFDFVKTFMGLKQEFPGRVHLSFNYLRHPQCLDVQYLPDVIKQQWVNEIDELLGMQKLNRHEYQQLKRFGDYLKVKVPDEVSRAIHNADLLLYAEQLDQRRGLSFSSTFPELADALKR